MSASPESISRRERTVMVVAAVLVVGALGAGLWAVGRRGPSSRESAVAAAASSQPVSAATLAAIEAAPAPETPGSPTATPTASESPAKAHGEDDGASSRGTSSSSSDSSEGATSGTSGSSASRTPTPHPTPTPKPTRTSPAVTAPTAAHFVVAGKVKKKTYFTVAKLKKMRTFSDDDFSRGKEPPEATTAFVGVRLTDILKIAGLAKDAKRVTILAADDYSASFSLRQVRADYIDETRPGVSLPMIIAYSEDGTAYSGDHPFRLAMGQALEGDYNRQYWVKIVVSITVL